MTLAHPATVLPLGRLGLPMTALVAGSVVPDMAPTAQASALSAAWHLARRRRTPVAG